MKLKASGGTKQVRRCGLLLLLFSFQCAGESITTCLDFEPFEVTQEGKTKWNGSNIETLHHVAEAASLDLDTRIRAPFARCLELLKSGQIDILPGLIHSEERADSLLLLPYTLRHELALFYLAGTAHPITPETITGKEAIGVHRVFALPQVIKKHPVHKQLVPISSVDVGFEMLVKGRLDGLLATIEAGKTVINDTPAFINKLDYSPFPLDSDIPICFGISKSSPFAKRIADIQSAIDLIATKPELNHLKVVPSKLVAH